MINNAIALCKHVYIIIGSSQESGTEKNPYSYEFRKRCIEKVLAFLGESKAAVTIMPLPDAGVGDGPAWGDYVMMRFMQTNHVIPDLIITAQENVRTNWFNNYTDRIALLALPKYRDIHATDIRKFLLEDNFPEFAMRMPSCLWDEYKTMRDLILPLEEKE